MPVRNGWSSWLPAFDFVCCLPSVFLLGLGRDGGQHRFHKYAARSCHWPSGKTNGDRKISGSRENRLQRDLQTEPDCPKEGRLFCLSLPRWNNLERLDRAANLRNRLARQFLTWVARLRRELPPSLKLRRTGPPSPGRGRTTADGSSDNRRGKRLGPKMLPARSPL